MPMGPGAYDEECGNARLATNARGCLLIIIDGNKGSGFSCQGDARITLTLPEILEYVATQIRASYQRDQP